MFERSQCLFNIIIYFLYLTILCRKHLIIYMLYVFCIYIILLFNKSKKSKIRLNVPVAQLCNFDFCRIKLFMFYSMHPTALASSMWCSVNCYIIFVTLGEAPCCCPASDPRYPSVTASHLSIHSSVPPGFFGSQPTD